MLNRAKMTILQEIGNTGEQAVKDHCVCPKCNKGRLKILPPNFKCADVICDFCGFLAQVKARNVKRKKQEIKKLPRAAWKPQKERMDVKIFFPLFIVDILKAQPIQIYFLDKEYLTNPAI